MTLGIAATLIVSCAKENAAEKIVPAGFKTVEYTVASEAAKTSLSGDGADKTVNWVEGDEITIFYEGGSTTATASSSGPSTTFSAIVPEQAVCHAVYPSYAAVYADDAFAVTIPAEQDGAFANGNMSVAHLEESGVSTFYNVTSFVKVIVNDADYTKVVLKAVGGEDIAGTLAVTLDGGPEIGEVTEGESEITLNVAEPGTYYVAIVPDVTFTKGILVTYYKGDVEAGSYFLDANITIGRAMIASVGAAEERIGDYYVSETGAGSKSGKNEKNAMDPAALKALLDAVDDDKKPAQAAALNGSTIHFAAGTYDFGELVTMSYDQNVDVVFQGADEAASIITGNDEHRLLVVGDGVKATFDNIEFSHSLTAKSSEPAIVLESGSESTFTNCKVLDNVNKDAGGANHSQAGILAGGVSHFENCEFARNEASYGASLSFKADATVNGCNFHNNTGVGAPGNSLYISEDCTVNVENCQFYDNTISGDYGGAVSSCAGTLNMTGCSINNNQNTSKRGAAMRLWNGAKAVLTNCEMKNNHADSWGGAVYLQNTSSLEIIGGTYDNNDGQGAGFVSVADKANLKITGAALINNKATSGNGGAIVFESTGKLECTDVTFTGNTASSMAAVCYIGSGTAKFNGCIFGEEGKGNTASSSGGCFRIKTSDVTFDGCTFAYNKGTWGGVMSLESSTSPVIDIKNCHFNNNSSSRDGGVIMQDATATLTVSNSTFDGNSCTNGSEKTYGGVYASNAGSATFTDCEFGTTAGNTAKSSGGCFYMKNSPSLTLNNCTVKNSHSDWGGAFQIEGSSTAIINGGLMQGNYAKGGGLVNQSSKANLTIKGNAVIKENYATSGHGGAILMGSTGNLVCENSTFDGNYNNSSSGAWGGAIGTTENGTFTITGCTFTGNHSKYLGGPAINLQNAINGTISGCTFTGNYSDCTGIASGNNNGNYGGGAMRLNSTGAVTIDNCYFEGNHLVKSKAYNHAYGGAVYINSGGNYKFNGCKFKDNYAVRGGALCAWATGATIYLNGCGFDGNYISHNYGTTIHIEKAGSFCMNNCSINDNTYTENGTGDWQAAWLNLSTFDSACISNCSFMGSPRTGTSKTVATAKGAIIRFDTENTDDNYFVNNIIVTEGPATNNKAFANYNKSNTAYFTKRSDNSANGAGGSYTMVENPGSNGFDNTMFSGKAWDSTNMCWTWNGTMTGGNNTELADAETAVSYINNVSGFKTWLESIGALYKDQLGNARPESGSWWPGAYQSSN